jgi:hypothetical protein
MAFNNTNLRAAHLSILGVTQGSALVSYRERAAKTRALEATVEKMLLDKIISWGWHCHPALPNLSLTGFYKEFRIKLLLM